MPIYVYRNLTTGETFEIEQRMTEDALTEHPETGDPVKRLIQPVGIAFKGSGFYVTDSRSSNGAKGKSAGGEAKSADASTPSDAGAAPSDGKGETKGASAPSSASPASSSTSSTSDA